MHASIYLFILPLLKFAGDWGILFFNFLFLQVIQGRLDSLAVATIKALTTVMHKSPAAKVTTTLNNLKNDIISTDVYLEKNTITQVLEFL